MMKHLIFIFSIMLVGTYGIYGQITDNVLNKKNDTIYTHSCIENRVSAIQNILKLESENIVTVSQMLNILNEEVRRLETRIDSLSNWFNIGVDTIRYFQAIPLSLRELQDADTYFSIDKAKRNPLSVFKLDLSRNALSAVPSEIRQFKNLQKLILSDNLLTELPSWIKELVSLQYLYVSNNRFEEFPPYLLNMERLVLIDLSDNPLRYVPLGINQISTLEVLNLHDTKVNYKALQRLESNNSNIIIR